MALPNKRPKLSPSSSTAPDFLPLTTDLSTEPKATQYGYTPHAPRAMRDQHRNDPRHARDRPKSKHVLPDHSPWILVKTKYHRQFVHNPTTQESLWQIPPHLVEAVRELGLREEERREKEANAAWAEEELRRMRERENEKDRGAGSGRRRRSESLQREDEEAMMAELAAEAEKTEEEDVKAVVRAVEPLKPVAEKAGVDGDAEGYGSESSYEEIEVTDSEGEEEEVAADGREEEGMRDADAPVEFGEDDIAFQLAAMEEDGYSDEYASEEEEVEDAENDGILFHELLDAHNISPFTPWDALLSNDTLLLDDRWTGLPSTRARKAAWEEWVKTRAAQVQQQRKEERKTDPKIAYLAFLSTHASPKLYWPEFKRKFKKAAEMNERRMLEKEREKLYREFVARMKLPLATRKADLVGLLRSVPSLGRGPEVEELPAEVVGHLHFYSLDAAEREAVVRDFIAALPRGRERSEVNGTEERVLRDEKAAAALEARARVVEAERRQAEKEERWARRDLQNEEREVRKAMQVGRDGLKANLIEGE